MFNIIRNVILYLLTGNLAEVLVVFIGMIFGFEIFLPIQLLYINLITDKLKNINTEKFDFSSVERMLIDNRKKQIAEKCEYYADRVYYKEILGMKAGIVFIAYEYRNELAEYFRENNFDMDFTMMVALDPGVVSYRSVKDGVKVRPVAELFGGKGHEKAATNPITKEHEQEILKVLTKTNKE